MIHALVLLFSAIWPFHHHKPALPAGVIMLSPLSDEAPVHPDVTCDYENGSWYYVGGDGMVGLSTQSCNAAYQQWWHENPIVVREVWI